MNRDPAERPSLPAVFEGLRLGVIAGLMLGAFEGVERALALRDLLRGPVELASLCATVAFYPLLTGALLGIAGGLCAGLARVARDRLPFPAGATRSLLGGVMASAFTALGLLALTFTVRFDGVIALAPLVLAAAFAPGMLAGLLAPRAGSLARSGAGRVARVAVGWILPPALVALYFMNAYFAPQSSYGVHLIMDYGLAAGALLGARLLPRAFVRVALATGVVALPLLAIVADAAMRTRPRIELLAKTRTSTSGRCLDFWSFLLDWDRDGTAPPMLVGGDDMHPLDPRRPPPILGPGSPGDPAAGGGGIRFVTELGASAPGVPAVRPHVVLLTLDALRADAVLPGPRTGWPLFEHRPPTPVLDSLAQRSAIFDAGYSPSAGTEDTFASLFTGDRLPGLLEGVDPDRYLPTRFLKAGYAVRGFFDYPGFREIPWGWSGLTPDEWPSRNGIMVDIADFLGDLPPGQPGLAWIHVMDLHAELLSPFRPGSYSRRSAVLRYSAALARVDSLVGVLCDGLRRHGLEAATLLVTTADHGEEFGVHGHFHHNLSVYEEAVRVPLWLSGPGIRAGGRPYVVSLQDLYPTLLQAAHVAPGASTGRSLWPILAGHEAGPDERWLYSFLPHRGFSRRYSPWSRPERGQAALLDAQTGRKVILRFRRQTWEAYDTRRDPRELDNLAGAGIGWPDSMLACLRSIVRAHGAPLVPPPR